MFYSGPLAGVSDALGRAKSAFGRALALDSSFARPLSLFTTLAGTLRDTAGMKRGLSLLLSTDSTLPQSTILQWQVATTLGDTAAVRRILQSDSMVSTHADAGLGGAIWDLMDTFVHEGLGLRDVDQVLQRSLAVAPTGAQRDELQNMQFKFKLMRGHSTGLTPPARWGARLVNQNLVLNALFSDGDPILAVPAAAALERELGTPAKIWCCLERFATAEYALEVGRLPIAHRALADIRRSR